MTCDKMERRGRMSVASPVESTVKEQVETQ